MNIVLDARNIHLQMNGLGRYARHLISALARLDARTAYTLVKKPEIREPLVRQSNFSEVVASPEIASLRNSFFEDRTLSRLECDLYHSLFQFLPKTLRARHSIVTLHDFMWIDSPKVTQPNPVRAFFVRRYAQRAFRQSLRRVDHAIAISEFTAQRAIDLYPRLRGKITVISHGVDALEGSGTREELPIPLFQSEYLLVVGNSRPYKNIPAVLRAFASIRSRLPDSVVLAVCGRGDHVDALKHLGERLDLTKRLVFVGSVDNRTLHALYKNALALTFPSLVEGFGLPVIEAMAHGCPVLTSNRPPLSDIAGGAAILVDPHSVDSIADGILQIATNEAFRNDLRQRGLQRSLAFTWEKAAQETLNVYRSVLA